MERRILIVSEDTSERNRYAQTLVGTPPASAVSYTITTVGSVAAAQLQATRQRFHLVIVALRQQDDGLELSSRLKELFPDMRLLLLCEQGVTKAQLKTARMIRASVAESTIDANSLRAVVADLLGLWALNQPEPASATEAAPPSSATNERPAPGPQAIQSFLTPFLEELRQQTRALVALYVDSEGCILAQHGDAPRLEIAALAALLAPRRAETLEMGRLLQNGSTTHLGMHESKRYVIYTANVKETRSLALVFDKEQHTPKPGIIMVMIRRSAEQVARIN